MHIAGSFAFAWLTVQKLLLHAIAMCVSFLLLAGCFFESHISGITLHIGTDLPHGAIFWDEIGPSWGNVAPSWGYLGPSSGYLGQCSAILGPSRVILGSARAFLDPFWANLASVWAILGQS